MFKFTNESFIFGCSMNLNYFSSKSSTNFLKRFVVCIKGNGNCHEMFPVKNGFNLTSFFYGWIFMALLFVLVMVLTKIIAYLYLNNCEDFVN